MMMPAHTQLLNIAVVCTHRALCKSTTSFFDPSNLHFNFYIKMSPIVLCDLAHCSLLSDVSRLINKSMYIKGQRYHMPRRAVCSAAAWSSLILSLSQFSLKVFSGKLIVFSLCHVLSDMTFCVLKRYLEYF